MFGVNSSTPLVLHAPPRGLGASHMVMGAPPAISRIRSLPAEKNAILRLSGDQKGKDAFSVLSSTRVSPVSNDRSQRRPSAPKAIFVPSGESTGGAPTSPMRL